MSVLSSPLEKERMGERLALIRKELALTQNQMAISLGVSHRAYTNYERGEREMPAGFLVRLMKKHKYDPVWVMNGHSDEPQLVTYRKFDPDLMSDVYCLIDELLQKRNKRLPAKDFIAAANLAYEICADEGGVDSKKVATIIKFAA
jgi:transcriptional regulator with XRE-family HTH domain